MLQKLVNMEKSDLYDVLEYVFNGEYRALTREQRVMASRATILALLNDKQKEFIDFVLSKYVEVGVEELDQEKLPVLLTNKYQSLDDAIQILGDVKNISSLLLIFRSFYTKRGWRKSAIIFSNTTTHFPKTINMNKLILAAFSDNSRK